MLNPILQNAIDSITVGVEDYKSLERKRLVSAVRNVVVGMLLLFKEELRRKSPHDEIFIKSKILPSLDENNELVLVANGENTVNVDEILERFKKLGIKVNIKKIENIISERNKLEHYYSNLTHEAIRGFLVDAFSIILFFINDVLEEVPKDLLGEEIIQIFLEEEKIYKEIKALCNLKIQEIKFVVSEQAIYMSELACIACGSELLLPLDLSLDYMQINFQCQACQSEYVFEEDIEKLVSEHCRGVNYSSIKDGGDAVTAHCPECCSETFIVDLDFCMLCGSRCQYKECGVCGESLSVEEQELEGLCSSCNYRWSKIEKE